jgi:hypothetical protein
MSGKLAASMMPPVTAQALLVNLSVLANLSSGADRLCMLFKGLVYLIEYTEISRIDPDKLLIQLIYNQNIGKYG